MKAYTEKTTPDTVWLAPTAATYKVQSLSGRMRLQKTRTNARLNLICQLQITMLLFRRDPIFLDPHSELRFTRLTQNGSYQPHICNQTTSARNSTRDKQCIERPATISLIAVSINFTSKRTSPAKKSTKKVHKGIFLECMATYVLGSKGVATFGTACFNVDGKYHCPTSALKNTEQPQFIALVDFWSRERRTIRKSLVMVM